MSKTKKKDVLSEDIAKQENEVINNTTQHKVSLFNAGHLNKQGKAVLQCRPSKDVTILQIYEYIISQEAKNAVEQIRAEEDENKQRSMKVLNLPYITPFGTFSYRNTDSLIEPSGLLVIDIDHINEEKRLHKLREALINDKRFTTALLFTSPRGHGLKWLIEVDGLSKNNLREHFNNIARYIAFEYGIDIDSSGKDVPRCCFLTHDQDCYINKKYLNF